MSLNRPHVLELFTPGAAITAHANGDLQLGTLVALVNGTDPVNPAVATAPAGSRAFGIAATNATDGDLVLIQRGNGRCFRVPATSGIAAGADLEVGLDGQPVTAAGGVVVATALRASTADHVDITLV